MIKRTKGETMKLFQKFKISLCIVFAIGIYYQISLAGGFQVEQFINPGVCADCHSDIYSQWENSMHNLSHEDEAYVKIAEFLLQGLTDPDEIKEAQSCVKCHTPVGFSTGYPLKLSDSRDNVPEIATRGIQCDYCHSVTGAVKMYNNDLQLSPGNGEDDPGVKRGPFDDSQPDFHEAAFSKFHTGSEICGTCHNVKHVVFGTDLETTYDEWKSSPYNSKDPEKAVPCQGCHMVQRPGVPATGATPRPLNPGTAADYSDERDHIFTHYFVGANGFIPSGKGDTSKTQMARERLENAATLSIDAGDIMNNIVKVSVTNSGAGHSIPTGVSDLRQVWLSVVMSDTDGNIIFSSGQLDQQNYLPADAITYKTDFGDENGNLTRNISKARKILKDYRIPALQTVTESIRLPDGDKKGMTLTVKLLYRSLSHRLLDQIPGMSHLKPETVTMAETRITL